MRSTNSLALVAALVVATFLGGCGRLLSPQGVIQGRVIYQNGTGVAGASVTVDGTSLSALSDSEGNFTISGVPAGRHTLKVAKEAYRRAGEFALLEEDGQYYLVQDGTQMSLEEGLAAFAEQQSPAELKAAVEVVVPSSGTVGADVVLAAEGATAFDTLEVYAASPQPGSAVSPGTLDFRIDANYSLVSDTAGSLVYLVSYKTPTTTQTAAATGMRVAGGSRAAALQVAATIPSQTETVKAMLMLVDRANRLLSAVVLPQFELEGKTGITEPLVLGVAQADVDGVKLSWTAPARSDFLQYIVYRNDSELARITDPSVMEYTDLRPLEDEQLFYRMDMVLSGSTLKSNTVVVDTLGTWLTVLPVSSRISSLVADPSRGFVYGVMPDDNRIVRIDVADNRVDAYLPVCSGAFGLHLAADGALAVTTCRRSDSVAIIDLDTFSVSRIIQKFSGPDLSVLDSLNDKLYVVGYRKYYISGYTEALIWVYDLTTDQVEREVTVDSCTGAVQLSPDGELLYCSQYRYGEIDVYQTSDLSLTQTLSVPKLYSSSEFDLFLDSAGSRLFGYRYIHEATAPWTELQTLDATIRGISPDGNRIVAYAVAPGQLPYIEVLTHDGNSFQPERPLYSRHNYGAAAAWADKAYVYRYRSEPDPESGYSIRHDDILIIDLALRRSGQ